MSLTTHRIVVSDTSCLILLSKINKLTLLKQLYSEIYIPEAVYNEIVAKQDNASMLINTSNWIRVCKIIDRERLNFFPDVLHLGEKEAMLLYEDIKADLIIIDDNSARKEATRRGQKVTGILGVLSRAKEKGLINEVRPLINELLNSGYFISENVLDYLYQSLAE